jgi:hypothetical protein
MNKLNNSQPPTENSYDDEIDLREILLNLWKYKILIIALSLIGAGLGVGFSIINTKYVSNGFFLVSSDNQDNQDNQDKKITIDRYKIYKNVIFDGKRFEDFLKKNGKLDGETSEIFKPVFQNKSAIEKIIIPEFSSISDRDAKSLGVKSDATEKAYLMGFTLRLESVKPLGEMPFKILEDYIRLTIVDVDLEQILKTKKYESESGLAALKNAHINSDFSIRIEIEQQILKLFESNNSKQELLSSDKIKSDFEITQQENRYKSLQELVPKLSNSRSAEFNNIITINKESEVFLPINSQLLANKIRIDDLKMMEPRRQFEILVGEIKRQFFLECLNAIREANSGPDFIETTKIILNKIIPPDALKKPAYSQAWNDIEIQRKAWEVSYMTNIAKFNRERVSAELIKEYYSDLLDSFKNNSDKTNFIKEVPKIKGKVFSKEDQNKDFVKIISNKIDIEAMGWSNYYFSKIGFNYPPGDSYKESKPSKPVGFLIGLMAGGMGGCFLALFLSWWKKDSINTAS